MLYDLNQQPVEDNLLRVLAAFPTERLTRCGATPTQLVAELANWGTHTIEWQAEMGLLLDGLSDPVIRGFLAGVWPPPIPSEIPSWPSGTGEELFDNGDLTWTFLSDHTLFVDNGDGTTTVTPGPAEYFSDNGDLSTTVTIGIPFGVGEYLFDNGDGTFTLTLADSSILLDNGDGTFTLTLADGSVLDNGDGTFTLTLAA